MYIEFVKLSQTTYTYLIQATSEVWQPPLVIKRSSNNASNAGQTETPNKVKSQKKFSKLQKNYSNEHATKGHNSRTNSPPVKRKHRLKKQAAFNHTWSLPFYNLPNFTTALYCHTNCFYNFLSFLYCYIYKIYLYVCGFVNKNKKNVYIHDRFLFKLPRLISSTKHISALYTAKL